MDYIFDTGSRYSLIRKAMISSTVSGRSVHAMASARVNLLGEHTDYTGGLVLPLAIGFTTHVRLDAAALNHSFESDRFLELRTFPSQHRVEPMGNWTDYPIGVLRELQQLGIEPPPFSLRLSGDVPLGAGLSSSASVEVATCIALLEWAGTSLPLREIALLCQRAENRFVGSPCGIMDQAVIAAARKGHALLIHTRELSFESVPLNLGALSKTRIVICNSEVKHSIATGEYGQRRKEVELGQAVLRSNFSIRDLGDATLNQLALMEQLMPEKSYRRCRHIISENIRVQEARAAMFAGDAIRLGELMVQGHASERDDFDCSCIEIDYLVQVAMTLPGCYGARLTGGGFGGCTVNLVDAEKADEFCAELCLAYRQKFGIEAQTWVCEAVDGAVAQSGFITKDAGGL